MYTLRGNMVFRGFSLKKKGLTIFRTRHRYGVMRSSMVFLDENRIDIESQNLSGDELSIRKNGQITGNLDISDYLCSFITLNRKDGRTDSFKLIKDGYAERYTLSRAGNPILQFEMSLNPFLFESKYRIEVLESSFR